jgi:putative transposase
MSDRHRDVALFRYSLIRPAADPELSTRQRGRMVRQLAAVEHVGPFGDRFRVSRTTIDRWIRAYRTAGFDALVPTGRTAEPYTPATSLELAARLKKENPGRTAAQIVRVITAEQGWSPSERTIQRHFAQTGLNLRPDGTPPEVFGRFEAAVTNDLWTGDAMHGIAIAGHKTYLLAFIDDHSRLLCGYRWTYAEDTVRLERALRSGLESRGTPRRLYVDNGSAFASKPLLRACAVLGIGLIHSTVRRPEGRGKIERFFRTVRDQFMIELALNTPADLDELNRKFTAWVETVYHRRTHSETGQPPLERFDTSIVNIADRALLHEAFLWSQTRTVTKTATVSLLGNHYEVDAALVGRKVELIYDPFDLNDIEVRYDQRPMGKAVPFRIGRHTHPAARPDPVTEPAETTGINYLGLIEHQRSRDLAGAGGIDFNQLGNNHTTNNNAGRRAGQGEPS